MKRSHDVFSSSVVRKCILLLFMSGMTTFAFAQKWGVKTNLLYDVTSTFNLGVEFGLAPRWTFALSGNYNP